jgi:thiol-disulfide isomerase/thioredoxin
LLVFHAVWCKPCAELEAKVLPKPEVQAALASYRVQSYDAELDQGEEAAKRFDVHALPTLLVLSPKGDEVDRIRAQDATGIAQALGDLRALALRVPVADDAVATEKDARALLVTARIVAKSDPVRAARAYHAAAAHDTDPKKTIAAEAAFALLRIEAQERAARDHARALLDFVSQYPTSDEALGAFDGLAALPASARPDRAAVHRAAVRLMEPRLAARADTALRGLAATLLQLGDVQDAVKASPGAVSDAQGRGDGAPAFVRGSDPLDACTGSSGGPPQMDPRFAAMFSAEQAIARRVVAACKQNPRNEDHPFVRINVKDGAVEHGVLLEPEAPEAISKCVATALQQERNVPQSLAPSSIFQLLFPPSTQPASP